MRDRLEQVIAKTADDVRQMAEDKDLSLRDAAYARALGRLCEAARARGTESYFS